MTTKIAFPAVLEAQTKEPRPTKAERGQGLPRPVGQDAATPLQTALRLNLKETEAQLSRLEAAAKALNAKVLAKFAGSHRHKNIDMNVQEI